MMNSSHRGIDDFISEALECPICTQIFDQPKQLNCGHSLCTHCIDRLVELRRQSPPNRHHGLGGFTRETYPISISCPVCREHTEIPIGGLSINYALGELISRFRTTQELKRICGKCQESVNYEAQMFCTTCSQQSPTSFQILCIKCALDEHSKQGHTIQQVEPTLEAARRDAIQQIVDFKGSATAFFIESEAGSSDAATMLLQLPETLKHQLHRFDTLQSELESMDICPTNVSREKINEAESIANAFREGCNAYINWLQNVLAEAAEWKRAMTDAFETNHNSSPSVQDCVNIQDLAISEGRQDEQSSGSTSCLQFIRSTPPQRALEIIRQRRRAAIARRHSGTRHVNAEHQLRSNNPFDHLRLSHGSNPIIITNSNLNAENATNFNDVVEQISGETRQSQQQQQQPQQPQRSDIVRSEEVTNAQSDMN